MTYPFTAIPGEHFIHRARRFPIRPDTKRPALFGWQNASTNAAVQIAAWASQFPACAWAIAYAESGLILVETDPKAKKTRGSDNSEITGDVRADVELAKLFISWGLPRDLLPHFRSRSGGKHYVFRAPPGINLKDTLTPTLPGESPDYRYRQGELARVEGFAQACIECKINGFGLIPPSSFEGRAYTLWPDGPTEPYDAPQGLIDATQRMSTGQETFAGSGPVGTIKSGSLDPKPLIKMIFRVFNQHPPGHAVWRDTLFGLVDQFGKRAAWTIGHRLHDGSAEHVFQTNDIIRRARETPRPGDVSLNSFFKYARECGDTEWIQKTASGMFGTPIVLPDIEAIMTEIDMEALGPKVALPPAPSGAMPMVGASEHIFSEGLPIVESFNRSHASVPHATDDLELPLDLHVAPLRGPLTEAIGKMVTLADQQRGAMKFDAIGEVFGVLARAHEPTFNDVVKRIRQTGAQLPDGKLRTARDRFDAQVQRAYRTGQGFRLNNKGEPDRENADNVAVFLQQIGVEVRFNVYANRAEIRWAGKQWVPFNDAELTRLRRIASQEEYRFRPSKDFFRDMVEDHARDHRYDPVLDRIDGIIWDRVNRLDTWLQRACGVANDAYYRAVSRNVIGGLVKRARRPGAKHDEILLLIGRQGIEKSTLCKVLALQEEWYLEKLRIGGRPQDIIPEMSGKLIIELSELAGLKKADTEELKAFITSVNDRATLKYKAYASDQLRRFIFVATTNDQTPLQDPTGNRRFLPVHVRKAIDIAWLRGNIDQLIAEAAAYEAEGETFGIPEAVWSTAAEHQEAARKPSAAEEIVTAWFNRTTPQGTRTYILSSELAEAMTQARLSANVNLTAAFAALGYEQRRPYVNGQRVRVWVTQSDLSDRHVLDGAYQWRLGFNANSGRVSWTLQMPLGTAMPTAMMPRVLPPPPY